MDIKNNTFCPKCGQEIKVGAKFCRFCGCKFGTNSKEFKSENKADKGNKIAASMVLLVFLAIPILAYILSNITTDDTYTSPPSPPRATIEVLNAKIVNHGYGYKEIQGIVKNNSNATCSDPRVLIYTFDSSGNRVGEYPVPIFNSLAPNETFKFKLPIFDASRFEVKSCYCEEY